LMLNPMQFSNPWGWGRQSIFYVTLNNTQPTGAEWLERITGVLQGII
jgi:hypothetical protein